MIKEDETQRGYIAAGAMQGLLASCPELSPTELAETAVQYADALISALLKKEGK